MARRASVSGDAAMVGDGVTLPPVDGLVSPTTGAVRRRMVTGGSGRGDSSAVGASPVAKAAAPAPAAVMGLGSWPQWRNSFQQRPKERGSGPARSREVSPPPPADDDEGTVAAQPPQPAPAGTAMPFLYFLRKELSWGHRSAWSTRQERAPERVGNLLLVPWRVESFAWFGHMLSLDLFLFHFTLLPVRCLLSVAAIIATAARAVAPRALLGDAGSPSSSSAFSLRFTRASLYDLLKLLIVVAVTALLGMIQLSRVYHYIRGEAAIKLFVVFNILEVLEKLCASIGSDVMDSLYRVVRDNADLPAAPGAVVSLLSSIVCAPCRGWPQAAVRRHASVAASLPLLLTRLLFAVAYAFVHAAVILLQVVTLNVALNSKNNAMLPLLVSNNFVELKSHVFKRIEAESLFQISCADAVERFLLVTHLALIALHEGVTTSLAWAMASMFIFELIVDWIKHSFISRFNHLHPDLYTLFAAILAFDTVSIRKRWSHSLDPTHAVVRRLGLATLPIAAVVLRMAIVKVPPSWFPRVATLSGALVLALLMVALAVCKMLLSMVVLRASAAVLLTQQRAVQQRGAAAVAPAGAVASGGDIAPGPATSGHLDSERSVGSHAGQGSGVAAAGGRAQSTTPAASTLGAAGPATTTPALHHAFAAASAVLREESGGGGGGGSGGSPRLSATAYLQQRAPPRPPSTVNRAIAQWGGREAAGGVRSGSGGTAGALSPLRLDRGISSGSGTGSHASTAPLHVESAMLDRLSSLDRYTLAPGARAVPM